MGMYTELHFNTRIIENCPEDIVAVLKFMVGEGPKPKILPQHALFGDQTRWSYMLVSDSYYFAMLPGTMFEFDDIPNQYFLSVRTNLKNYDNEIQLFLDWIDPYLDMQPGDFLGFYRYEETETPTLIYKP